MYKKEAVYLFLLSCNNDLVKDLLKIKNIRQKLNTDQLDNLMKKIKEANEDNVKILNDIFEKGIEKNDEHMGFIKKVRDVYGKLNIAEELTKEQIKEIKEIRNKNWSLVEESIAEKIIDDLLLEAKKNIDKTEIYINDDCIKNRYDKFIEGLMYNSKPNWIYIRMFILRIKRSKC